MIAPQPFFSPRGTPFSVLHRIKALSSLGHQIDLVTYHLGQNIPITGLCYYRTWQLPGVNRIKIGPSLVKIPMDALLVLKALRLLMTQRYDYLHTHEEAGFFGNYLAKLFGLPHLYDMHSSLPQQLGNFKFTKSSLLVKIFKMLEDSAVHNAAGLITICPDLHDYVQSIAPEKPHRLIENVADNSIVFDQQPIDLENLRTRWQLNGKPIVLYYGTFEPYQGLDLFLESARVLLESRYDFKCVLVGGSEEQVRNHQLLAQQLGIEKNVIFTGSLQPWEIPGFIRISDVLVSPRLEGTNTPLKIYSYLRSGKPIVATRHVTHTQVLNDQVAILTDISPKAFALGIAQCFDDKAACARLVKNAQLLADNSYSYQKYLDTTKSLLAEMMEKWNSRR